MVHTPMTVHRTGSNYALNLGLKWRKEKKRIWMVVFRNNTHLRRYKIWSQTHFLAFLISVLLIFPFFLLFLFILSFYLCQLLDPHLPSVPCKKYLSSDKDVPVIFSYSVKILLSYLPPLSVGQASLSTTVSTYGQILWCQQLTTWEKNVTRLSIIVEYPFWTVTSLDQIWVMLLQVWRKASCECKWKKRWCRNEEWYSYPCSFSHNAVLTEVLHFMIINHVLISITTIVRVNLICHWIPYELYCINQP